MTLVKRFNNQMPELNYFFDDFLNGDFFTSPVMRKRYSEPSINVKENETEYQIEVAAPGLKKENFSIEIENGILTISYDNKEENEEKAKDYTRCEFSYSSFQRSFSVPKDKVDDSKIEASYNDGILNITLHKREEAKPKPARAIEIK